MRQLLVLTQSQNPNARSNGPLIGTNICQLDLPCESYLFEYVYRDRVEHVFNDDP